MIILLARCRLLTASKETSLGCLLAAIQAFSILCRTNLSLSNESFMLQQVYALSMVAVVAMKTRDTVSSGFLILSQEVL